MITIKFSSEIYWPLECFISDSDLLNFCWQPNLCLWIDFFGILLFFCDKDSQPVRSRNFLIHKIMISHSVCKPDFKECNGTPSNCHKIISPISNLKFRIVYLLWFIFQQANWEMVFCYQNCSDYLSFFLKIFFTLYLCHTKY